MQQVEYENFVLNNENYARLLAGVIHRVSKNQKQETL